MTTERSASLRAETNGMLSTTAFRLAAFLGIINLEQAEAYTMQVEAKLQRGENLNAELVCRDHAKLLHDAALEFVKRNGGRRRIQE